MTLFRGADSEAPTTQIAVTTPVSPPPWRRLNLLNGSATCGVAALVGMFLVTERAIDRRGVSVPLVIFVAFVLIVAWVTVAWAVHRDAMARRKRAADERTERGVRLCVELMQQSLRDECATLHQRLNAMEREMTLQHEIVNAEVDTYGERCATEASLAVYASLATTGTAGRQTPPRGITPASAMHLIRQPARQD